MNAVLPQNQGNDSKAGHNDEKKIQKSHAFFYIDLKPVYRKKTPSSMLILFLNDFLAFLGQNFDITAPQSGHFFKRKK
jgi:hypothetical protein